jgi:hypothetical protein
VIGTIFMIFVLFLPKGIWCSLLERLQLADGPARGPSAS